MAAKYPTWHMAGINDVFKESDDYSFIRGEGNISRQYNAPSKRGLSKQIFHCFMKQALEDVIENGDVLEFPLYDAAILIEEIPSDIVRKRRAEGKFEHFSEIFALGKAYDIIYRFKSKNRYLKWRVIVSKSLYERFVDLVNSGKQYFKIAKAW